MRFATRPPDGPPLAEQAASRSTAQLVAARTAEAETLMAAGTAVMERHGTDRRATVSEIVREAGLSNQAFYRHFASKDALVAAIVDAGARRLVGYLDHQMAGTPDPERKVRIWVKGVLSQATDEKVARPTRAVSWNRGDLASEADGVVRRSDSMIWQLLEAPLAELGSNDPQRDAYLVGKLVFSVLIEALWADPPPTAEELEFVQDFCLAGVSADAFRASR